MSKVVEDALKQLEKASTPQEGRALKQAATRAQKVAKEMLVARDQMLKESLLQAAKASDPLGMIDRRMLAGAACSEVCTPACSIACVAGCIITGGIGTVLAALGGTAAGSITAMNRSNLSLTLAL